MTQYFHKLSFYIFACSLISRLQRSVYYGKRKLFKSGFLPGMSALVSKAPQLPGAVCHPCLLTDEARAHHTVLFPRNIGNSCQEFTFLPNLRKPMLQTSFSWLVCKQTEQTFP